MEVTSVPLAVRAPQVGNPCHAFEFLSQMKIPNLRDSLCQRWWDLWTLPFRENGSGVFGA